MVNYVDQVLGAVLTAVGAVLTASLAWVYNRASEWWKRPQVAIEIGSDSGHVYENVLIKSDAFGKLVDRRDAIFVRVKVTNKEGGYRIPSMAQNCAGFLAGLEEWSQEANKFIATKYQDFLHLEWSFSKETRNIDLLPGIPVWLDVVYILFTGPITEVHIEGEVLTSKSKPAVESMNLKIASNPPVHRYASGFDLPGLYRLKVQVSGENFGSTSAWFYVVVPVGSRYPKVFDELSWQTQKNDIIQGLCFSVSEKNGCIYEFGVNEDCQISRVEIENTTGSQSR